MSTSCVHSTLHPWLMWCYCAGGTVKLASLVLGEITVRLCWSCWIWFCLALLVGFWRAGSFTPCMAGFWMVGLCQNHWLTEWWELITEVELVYLTFKRWYQYRCFSIVSSSVTAVPGEEKQPLVYIVPELFMSCSLAQLLWRSHRLLSCAVWLVDTGDKIICCIVSL